MSDYHWYSADGWKPLNSAELEQARCAVRTLQKVDAMLAGETDPRREALELCENALDFIRRDPRLIDYGEKGP